MNTVSVSRTADVSPAVAADRLNDLGALMDAAGFDEVHVDGDRVRVVNHVSLATMELTVSVIESDAELAYEQVDGIFDEMVTRYEIEGNDAGNEDSIEDGVASDGGGRGRPPSPRRRSSPSAPVPSATCSMRRSSRVSAGGN